MESSHGAARTHVLVSLAAGAAAAGVSTLFTTWQIAVLIGWDVAAVVFMAWIRLIVGGMDGEATARRRSKTPPGRRPTSS